jgi:excisionase family DNA binding protein
MGGPSDPIDPSKVYTVPEAAQIARVSARTYYAAAARDEVPAVRVGRRLVVSGAALKRFLEGDEVAR